MTEAALNAMKNGQMIVNMPGFIAETNKNELKIFEIIHSAVEAK